MVIDEARSLREQNLMTGIGSGPLSKWRGKASGFIETVFGEGERVEFSAQKSVKDAVTSLEDLMRRRDSWSLRISTPRELEVAVAKREHYDEGEMIVIAGSPVARLAKPAPPSPDSEPVPQRPVQSESPPPQPRLPEKLRETFEPYPQTPEPRPSTDFDALSDPTGAAFMASLRKEHRRGQRIQSRIGKGGVPGMPDGPATASEVNSWEEDVCHIFEQRGRSDCIDRFMYDSPKKPNAVGTLLGGALEVILDRPLKERMNRRMAALAGLVRDLEK
jgi:hypothetical protein